MSNDTRYYFGAYLYIKVRKRNNIIKFQSCSNGHKNEIGNFCVICGNPILKQKESITSYPTLLDLIPENEYASYEDDLAIITPPSLYCKGVIIAINNKGNGDKLRWLTLSGAECSSDLIEILDFPSDKEINLMKEEFNKKHAKLIKLLLKSENIIELQIKSGYVLDLDY